MSQHRDLDVTKRDRFELLSAFLDGEVSPDERRLVMAWLTDDPETQCLYRRLLQIRRGFQTIGCEHWQTDLPADTATAVVSKLNRRFKLTCMAGMTAAAAAVVAVFSGALNYPMGQIGWTPQSISASSEDSLQIALDQPPIAIPKPASVSDIAPIDSTF
ncbi:Fis family transcriptional regulator [Oscillatoria sp. CS-180]|uniref:anti-sigma factor family protein n=1 Tax=Oscillatoria sp. CS-180 TaxID=3021720 RepID=UPI00232D7172|nr:Fis family transcriptional regulator [Oscillatoria sp. CS-180]MDB9528476.1 Fis family transcriptional regulator [Oscillatoria sp. CS-180]